MTSRTAPRLPACASRAMAFCRELSNRLTKRSPVAGSLPHGTGSEGQSWAISRLLS